MTLQELIQAWLDADPDHSVGVLARRAGMPRNTIYALMKKEPAGMPRKPTLQKLAHGLGEPLRVVEDAARRSAGYFTEALDSESQEVQAWVALLSDLPDERRADLWEIGRMYLRRAKDEP